MAEENIKTPEYAGLYYPSDPKELKKMLEVTLTEVGTLGAGYSGVPLRAMIVPSAGLTFAAKTALLAYQQIRNRNYSRVIILGASHFFRFTGVGMTEVDAYQSLNGNIPVDKRAVEYLGTGFDFHIHEEAFAKEYSIEVQLPYLQHFLQDFQILPLIVGTKLDVTATALVLSDLIDDETLVIVSTNLSHFHEETKARTLDQKTVDAILTKDTDLIKKNGQASAIQALALLNEVALLKGWQPTFLAYNNSAESGDDPESVVGYASFLYIQ